MTGFRVVNLKMMLDEIGEDSVRAILSDFSCPLNPDVEYFLRRKAIDFARQSWAQTHLVFASYRDQWVLVGYFALANKYIRISAKNLGKSSGTLRKRIAKFATYDRDIKAYIMAAPLIAQLGKNFANGYNALISGSELLEEACNKISRFQFELGGHFAYLECEDKPKLTDFYSANGFYEFDTRDLDHDEVEKLDGSYLVQMLKYIR